MTKQEFLSAAIAAAQTASSSSGFSIGAAVAQAALESAWGTSRLALKANNYFGIKAADSEPWIALPTLEVIEGEQKKVTARFARYGSVAECFAARERILLTAPCYAEARLHAREPIAFLQSLAKHWATDPGYGEKLEQIYLQNGFANL